MTKLHESWNKGERYAEFAQVLELPVMREALAVLEYDAKPNSAANALVVRGLSAKDAAFRLSCIANTQAGIQATVDKLRSLGRAPVEHTRPPEPEMFSHVTADYLEKGKI